MKGDISRSTFDRRSHYRSVRLQQGRVQLDADWNEQADLTLGRIETEAVDVIGGYGGPIDAAGFRVEVDVKHLSKAELGPGALPQLKPAKLDFYITAGRYYVDGMLCENERLETFLRQPDLPAPLNANPDTADDDGNYLIYLDAWERHVSAEEVPELRETALGGPDTATRARVVWQVKAFKLPAIPTSVTPHCLMNFPRPGEAGGAGRVRLQAQAVPEAAASGSCVIPPSVGYRGLGNQLFRVECHDPGAGFDVSVPPVTGSPDLVTVAEFPPASTNRLTLTAAPGWQVGDAVLMAAKGAPEFVAHILAIDGAVLTLSRIVVSPGAPATLRRIDATFKWCDENGSIASAIENYQAKARKLTVRSLGPDAVRGFAPRQLVEVTCPAWEVAGKPGFVTEIADVIESRREIVLVAALPADLEKEERKTLRRWQGLGAVTFSAAGDHWIGLRYGVQIQFDGGAALQADYWQIPARTATAEARSGRIEWPKDDTTAGGPAKLPPAGVNHRYCPLAVVSRQGGVDTLVSDCRRLFPPITQLTSLFFVTGDGQEAVPNPLDSNLLIPLPKPLVVGVANGQRPVDGATVRFTIVQEGETPIRGELATAADVKNSPDSLEVATSDGGLARCTWKLDPLVSAQQVVARLLDAEDKPIGLPVLFTATLSQAGQVAYDPRKCEKLSAAGTITVQQAIDEICQRESHCGCAVPVGKGCRFETVREAVAVLVQQAVTDDADTLDVCLCLHNGKHNVNATDLAPLNDIAKRSEIRLRITGCGRGTLIKLAGLNHAYHEWQALHLESSTIIADSQVSLDGLRDVSLRDCYLFHEMAGRRPALRIRNVTRLRVTDCLIEAWPKEETIQEDFNSFDALPPLKQLLENMTSDYDTFRRNLNKFLVDELPNATIEARKRIASNIRKQFAKNADAVAIHQWQIADLLEDNDITRLRVALLHLRGMFFKRNSAPAIAVIGSSGEIRFEGNDLSSGVIFYGENAGEDYLTEDKVFRKRSGRQRQIDGDSGIVHFHGNKMGRVSIAAPFRQALAELDSDDRKTILAFGAFCLSMNIFEATKNELLADSIILDGNIFAPSIIDANLGAAAANRAVFSNNAARVYADQAGRSSILTFIYSVMDHDPSNVVNQVEQDVMDPNTQQPRTIGADNTGLVFLG